MLPYKLDMLSGTGVPEVREADTINKSDCLEKN